MTPASEVNPQAGQEDAGRAQRDTARSVDASSHPMAGTGQPATNANGTPKATAGGDATAPAADAAGRDDAAVAVDREAGVALDAGEVPGTLSCDHDYAFPCADAVPMRGQIGALSSSDVPRPRCPEELPVAGEPCREPLLRCGYGNRPRYDCRALFVCSDGHWQDRSPPCYIAPEGLCPPQMPQQGEPCEVLILPVPDGMLPVCEYGSVACTCGPRFFRETRTGWVCATPPQTPGCPPLLPNTGEGCDADELTCGYGPVCQASGATFHCYSGAWTYGGDYIAENCGLD